MLAMAFWKGILRARARTAIIICHIGRLMAARFITAELLRARAQAAPMFPPV